jgi:hypothetical protein
MAPHTYSSTANKIQNLTIKQKNVGSHLLAQEGATSHQFVCLEQQTPSMLLLTVRR